MGLERIQIPRLSRIGQESVGLDVLGAVTVNIDVVLFLILSVAREKFWPGSTSTSPSSTPSSFFLVRFFTLSANYISPSISALSFSGIVLSY